MSNSRCKDLDAEMGNVFMEENGAKFVAFGDAIVDSRNLVAAITCLKANYSKLPHSKDPKQLFKDTKKKFASVPGAVCPVDLINRFHAAVNFQSS